LRYCLLTLVLIVAGSLAAPGARAQYYPYPPGYYPPGYYPPPTYYRPPPPPPYYPPPPMYRGGPYYNAPPAYNSANCGTPDEPKPCYR